MKPVSSVQAAKMKSVWTSGMEPFFSVPRPMPLPQKPPELIARWWQAHAARFADPQRYLCGQPVTEAHCRDVLSTGFQRQRRAAALELALMRADRPLFECRAPASRQQAVLKAGSGLGLA